MSNPEFFNIIALYNLTFWPITLLTILLGLVAIFFVFKKNVYSDRLIVLILAFIWFWVGIIFGFVFYGPWTPLVFGFPFPGFGYFYAVIFTLQGIIFLYFGVYRKALSFKFETNILAILGSILILYAIAFYWLVGFATGYPYPFYPIFGTAPCPVVIFTIGLFLWTDKRISPIVLILPTVYGLMAFIPVFAFGIYADIVLFISGFISLYLLYNHWKSKKDIES